MRYFELKKRSEELLKKILPLMAKQGAGYHPVSYTLWYEYIAGLNPGLQHAMQQRMADSTPLSDDETYSLFSQHILSREHLDQSALEAAMLNALKDVEESTITFNKRVVNYGLALGGCEEALGEVADIAAYKVMLSSLLTETKTMRTSVSELQGQLQTKMSEIASLKSDLQAAQGMAMTDSLTQLSNRRGFETEIRQYPKTAQEIALMLIDIDRFKAINDTYGHAFGDRVIIQISNAIKRNIRGGDFAARYAGDEFAVLLPNTSAVNARVVAEHIRAAVFNGRIAGGQSVDVGLISVSVGIAVHRAGEQHEQWFERVDAALYEAKRAGRNQVQCAP